MASVASPPNLRMLMRFSRPNEPARVREPSGGGGRGAGSEALPIGNYLPAGATPGDYTPGHNGGLLGLGDKQPQLTAQGQASLDMEQRIAQEFAQHLGNGGNFQSALSGILQDKDMAMALVMHPQLQEFLKNQATIAESAGKNRQIVGNQLVDKGTGASQTIQTENGPMAAPTPGSIQTIGTDASGNPIYATIPGSGSKAAPGIRFTPREPQQQTQIVKGADNQYHLIAKNGPNAGQEIGGGGGQQGTGGVGVGVPQGAGGKLLGQDERVLRAAPIVNNALNTVQQYRNEAGPLSGFVRVTAGGEYLGVNPKGEKLAAALNTLDTYAPQVWGGQQGGFTKSLLSTLPSEHQAPSYLATLSQQKQEDLRNMTQSQADLSAQRINGKLPQSLENQLEKMGVYSKGYEQNADAMWRLRNSPTTLTPPQVHELANWQDLHPDEPMTDVDRQRLVAAAEANSAQRANQIANPPITGNTQAPTQSPQQPAPTPQQPPAQPSAPQQNPAPDQNLPPVNLPTMGGPTNPNAPSGAP